MSVAGSEVDEAAATCASVSVIAEGFCWLLFIVLIAVVVFWPVLRVGLSCTYVERRLSNQPFQIAQTK